MKDYAFIQTPKKIAAFLTINQAAFLNILLDYQSLTNKDNFQISFSFLQKRLNICDQKAQKIIKELIKLNLISKSTNTGAKNTYSINFTYFSAFDKLSFQQIFDLRDRFNTNSNIESLNTVLNSLEAVTGVSTNEPNTIQEEIIEAVTEEQTPIKEEPVIESIQEETIQTNSDDLSLVAEIAAQEQESIQSEAIEAVAEIAEQAEEIETPVISIEETNTINEIEDNTEDKIITINNHNMEQIKKVLLNEQETTEKQVINKYQFEKILEQNNIDKRMIQLVNVYNKLGFEKMLNSEKEDYNNYINQYNSLLSNYQLIN